MNYDDKYKELMHRTFLEIGENDTNTQDLDLISLTKELVTISALNKKYNNIEYSTEFIQDLNEKEYVQFLNAMHKVNMITTKLFFNIHQSELENNT